MKEFCTQMGLDEIIEKRSNNTSTGTLLLYIFSVYLSILLVGVWQVLVISFVNKDNGRGKGGEASGKRASRVPKSKY